MRPLCLAVLLPYFVVGSLAANGQESAAKPTDAGLSLTYAGKLQAVNSDDDSSARSFTLNFIVTEITPTGGCRLAWILKEGAGRPRLSWAQRFGTVPVNKSLANTSDRELPAIQAERDGSVRAIALRLPFFAAAEPLKTGAAWEQGQLKFEVNGREDVSGRKCWRVGVTSRGGQREVVWVDEQDAVITRHREFVVLGQGVAHELSLDLEKIQSLSAGEIARQAKAHAALVSLRGPVKDKLSEWQSAGPAANAELLQRAKTALAEIQAEIKNHTIAELAGDAVRETQSAVNREADLNKFRDKLVGKPAQDLFQKTLISTRGNKISLADFKGKPTVLHFWEYRSEPKIAPYGETGYLDFIWRQREKQGVQVLGIAVDERADRVRPDLEGAGKIQNNQSAARKDIRSFCDFMNLSYPVGFDDGPEKLIDLFGDPRQVGGKLPLYIVIAPDGTVAEYHPGLWSGSADEGLKELDQRLTKLLK